MKVNQLGLAVALALSVLQVSESRANEKREQAKHELLGRPVFQNNLTPEAHLKSGSVPPVKATTTASNEIRTTGEQVEPRTPASESAAPSELGTQNTAAGEPETQAPEAAAEPVAVAAPSSHPLLWILPLLGLLAVFFYFVKRRK